MELIDSHCHLDFPEFSNVDQLWQKCRQQHIKHIIIPATEAQYWPRIQALCEQHPGCFWSAGLHPWWVNAQTFSELQDSLSQALNDPNCVAIGECGLDGGKGITELHKQALSWQLEQARDLNKPVILHAHKAHQELLSLLKKFQPLHGVVHGFHGSIELAQSYISLGFLIGIGGGITYPRAQKTRRTVSQLALEHIVLETDAPSMPLYGQQGKANSPLALADINQCLADIRSESPEKIANITSANSRRLFGLDLCDNRA
ncbi:TatD family hydrolase [Pseudoteredinibacter isoporae]|uniref:TatD DNase family protein n=1 Tax=Pseudoteredinibacter isoporae TaxID=570281 RepID=A0A7X0JTJ1_9GAMM|nr:TatD family hydrolase [Pseudoteredinibacter isoporae]MBB6521185.1 TatD DNase family protein [Pseudoteredinibacter isoporae]NHO86745.1 TatD family hydrolase [Pseudoteredinibacter isoporae]NIB24803.1 TatD family hydrolase [Pseudoteredinibacter isoporae]